MNDKKLSLIYDKKQKDFVVKYPRSCDGALVMNHICDDILKYTINKKYPYNFDVTNFKKELENRGYDLTTLKFSIELKKDIKNL
jgi:hypothetical protein